MTKHIVFRSGTSVVRIGVSRGVANVWLAAIMAITLGSLSCKKSDSEEVDSLISDWISERNDWVGVVCECWETVLFDDVLFESKQQCETEMNLILPAAERCIRDSFQRDTGSSKSYLECYVPLQSEISSCYDDRFTCDDAGVSGIVACDKDYDTGSKNCIDLPSKIERSIQECFN